MMMQLKNQWWLESGYSEGSWLLVSIATQRTLHSAHSFPLNHSHATYSTTRRRKNILWLSRWFLQQARGYFKVRVRS